MNYKRKKYAALILMVLMILSLCACAETVEEGSENGDSNQSNFSIETAAISAEDMFTNRDKEIGYEESEAIAIRLEDGASSCGSSAVTISGDTITITDEGIYLVSGTLTNGQIVVDAEKTDKLQIVLNGVDISCQNSAPIYIKQADKVFLTLDRDSDNRLATAGAFEADGDIHVDGVIFSKEDLTMNGLGSLTISTEWGHGVVSKDDLVITSGTYTITSTDHCLAGKDSVRIADGTFTLATDEDAIHSENDDDESLGFVYIAGGDITIHAGDDGIHAGNSLTVADGTITVVESYEGLEGKSIDISGGTISVVSSDDGLNAAGGNDSSGFIGGGRADNFSSSGDYYIHISGGTVYVDAEGDGIDSNGYLLVSGGEIYVSGPTNGADGALDYESYASITGGIVVAAGASGMAENFGSGSTQGAMMVNAASSQTGEIILKDADGKEILSYAPDKVYRSVVISCPEVKKGETYQVVMGTETTTVAMTDIIYGSGNGFGGGGMDGRPGGGNKDGTPGEGRDGFGVNPGIGEESDFGKGKGPEDRLGGFDGSMPENPSGVPGDMPDDIPQMDAPPDGIPGEMPEAGEQSGVDL